MDTTQLVCLSQELSAYQSMDSIANNLANVSTPGFKGEAPKFQEYLDQEQPSEGQTGTQSVSFVQQTGMMRDMSEGHIDITSAPFDAAINGSGYFVVQTANGTRYTRNGHFSLDQSGRIVDDAGDPIQGQGGDITIQQTDGDIHIAGDGTVSGINGQIGQLNIVDFADDRALVREGASLYSTTQIANTATDATVQQGAIESSNIQPVVEISKMIEVMRSYQAVINLSTSQANSEQQTLDKLATVQS
jgi:flagellar basal-body rod protein FlgF